MSELDGVRVDLRVLEERRDSGEVEGVEERGVKLKRIIHRPRFPQPTQKGFTPGKHCHSSCHLTKHLQLSALVPFHHHATTTHSTRTDVTLSIAPFKSQWESTRFTMHAAVTFKNMVFFSSSPAISFLRALSSTCQFLKHMDLTTHLIFSIISYFIMHNQEILS